MNRKNDLAVAEEALREAIGKLERVVAESSSRSFFVSAHAETLGVQTAASLSDSCLPQLQKALEVIQRARGGES